MLVYLLYQLRLDKKSYCFLSLLIPVLFDQRLGTLGNEAHQQQQNEDHIEDPSITEHDPTEDLCVHSDLCEDESNPIVDSAGEDHRELSEDAKHSHDLLGADFVDVKGNHGEEAARCGSLEDSEGQQHPHVGDLDHSVQGNYDKIDSNN